jgi:cytochrome c peroxidase
MQMRRYLAGVVATVVIAIAAACGSDEAGPPSPPALTADAGVEAAASVTALCVDGKPTATYPPEPHELAIGSTLPNLTFEGEKGPVALGSYFEPCAARSRLLLIRTSALWCGTCLWHATHTSMLAGDPRIADRTQLLDLVVADEDNLPATPAALARWRTKLDAAAALATDSTFTFRNVSIGLPPLPIYVIVDTRTMEVRSTESNPNPAALHAKLLVELAALDGAPRPVDLPVAASVDGFTEYERDLLRDITTPAAPPADPTNEYADDVLAAAFGKKLFSDVTLSPAGTFSCATCHDPAHELSDGLPQAVGVSKGDRNTPAIALAAHARWQFWDGRADTLWAQALGPLENAKELGSSRLFVAHRLATQYAADYAAVFAKYPLPDLADALRFPAAGKPGDAAWQGMTAADQDAVTRVFVNVGKAVAAFERTLRVKGNALDRYAAGDLTALDAPQKEGLGVFFKTGCIQCHWGPRLTNDAFHVLRFPTGRQDKAPDQGRSLGITAFLGAEFTAAKTWSDAPSSGKSLLGLTPVPDTMIGAFKTPTLRGLPKSGPYGHGGTFATLAEVSKHYGERGLKHDDGRAIGGTERWVPLFDVNAQSTLVPFLDVLSGEPLP